MVDFQPFNSSTHPIVKLEGDWNNLLAHGLEKGFNYIVRINGSYTEAITGTGTSAGTIAYGGADNVGATDGTDSAAVINAALANLTAGRDYKEGVKVVGDYTTNAALAVEGYTVLDLRAAKITLDADADSNGMTTTAGDDYIDILGGWLEGNSANNAAGHGIEIQSNSQEITINGCKIRDFKESGIRAGVASVGMVWIGNCVITGNTEHGIFASSFSDSFIYHNDIGSNGGNGIYMGSSSVNRILKNGIWLNADDDGIAGIYLYECSKTVIDGNILHDNYRNGLAIAGITVDRNSHNTVIGNIFYNNGEKTSDTYYDISLADGTAKYNSFIGNVFNSPEVKYAIFFTGTDPYPIHNTVIGNAIEDYQTAAMAATGTFADNAVAQNTGFITENCGIATIANLGTFVDVTHGLAMTPSCVQVTGQHQEVDELIVTAVGAATFRITTTVGATTDDRTVYWRAWYHP